MLAYACVSVSFLRYEHHRNRFSLVSSHAAKATSLSSSEPRRAPLSATCPGCQCPSQIPNPHLFQALPERWRRHTQSQHSTCAQGVLKVVSSFFQSADGHADVAAHPFHFTFLPTSSPTLTAPELHCPPPSPTPALGLAPSQAALSASEATRQS